MYWCSCNTSRAELLDSLTTHLDIQSSELESTFPECLHIKAVKYICTEVDAIHDISPEQEFSGQLIVMIDSH